MQKYFQVKCSDHSNLKGDPRSLSQWSVLSPNVFNAGWNSFTGAFPQPTRAPNQRVGNFVYPTRKILQQNNEVDPSSTAIVSNNRQRRPVSAFSGKPVPQWSRLYHAYRRKCSSKPACITDSSILL